MEPREPSAIRGARKLAASVLLAACAVSLSAVASALAQSPAPASPAKTVVVADTQRVTIKVTGMFCESCAVTVRAMLKRTDGVQSATVDGKRGEAVVSYDPTKTTPQALVDVINRLGYKASFPTASKVTGSG
jgi:copper chaperone CopZ